MKISDEKYTPLLYIESARKIFGGTIHLDPASSLAANRRIKAESIFTATDNGLTKDWWGNVWLNPPYSNTLTVNLKRWIQKISAQYRDQKFEQAILLTPKLSEEEIERILNAFNGKIDEGFNLDDVEKQVLKKLGAIEMGDTWMLKT